MSRFLLDSHVLLWLLDGAPALGPRSRQAIVEASVVHVSAVSRWELRLKSALGKLDLPPSFDDEVAAAGLVDLPLNAPHTTGLDLSVLPHRDPFDLMLVTQARVEGLTFLTADRAILAAWPQAADARE